MKHTPKDLERHISMYLTIFNDKVIAESQHQQQANEVIHLAGLPLLLIRPSTFHESSA